MQIDKANALAFATNFNYESNCNAQNLKIKLLLLNSLPTGNKYSSLPQDFTSFDWKACYNGHYHSLCCYTAFMKQECLEGIVL